MRTSRSRQSGVVNRNTHEEEEDGKYRAKRKERKKAKKKRRKKGTHIEIFQKASLGGRLDIHGEVSVEVILIGYDSVPKRFPNHFGIYTILLYLCTLPMVHSCLLSTYATVESEARTDLIFRSKSPACTSWPKKLKNMSVVGIYKEPVSVQESTGAHTFGS